MKFRKYLEEHYVICDGAMGTYYESLYRTDEKPEFANEKNPERILSIHREYVKAGANLIRTNTFASNTKSLKISLEAVRVNAKMTQKEWASKLGVSNSTVVNWEKGNTEPSLSQLREMSRLSGVPMDFIFVPDKSN